MKLLILDGNSIANRAYYGVHALSTSDGTPTNAVFGFLNILQRLMGEETPEAVCVTFDEHAPTFRREAYEGYKAQRKGMDEALQVQMPILREVLEAMRIPCYSLKRYEADDLIGTAAKKCEVAGWQCVIATGDKDSFQLISPLTSVKHVRSRQGLQETKLYTPESFFEEYGFTPEKIVDLKALMGDASDNIPGVPGVGEKTAMSLVQDYGTVKALYEKLDELPLRESLKKKLREGKDSMERSYWLATILRDVPGFDFVPGDNRVQKPDNDRLYSLFTTLEFTKMISKYGLTPPKGEAPAEKAELRSRKAEYLHRKALPVLTKLTSSCVLISPGLDMAVFTDGDTDHTMTREETEDYEDALKYLLSDKIQKSGHEVKELMRLCLEHGLPAEGWVFDAALAGYLLDATAGEYSLARLGETYCGVTLNREEENGQLSLLDEPEAPESALRRELDLLCALVPILTEKLTARGQMALLTDMELPLCRVLADMETAGAYIDTAALREYGEGLQKAAEGVQKDIWTMAGHEFNIQSPKQLGEVLFAERGLPAPKKTKTGWSTSAEVLEKLRGRDPIVDSILQYRELAKLKSTYADGLLREVRPDGRVHTRFQMTVTATGRLSSVEPNLQNIPVRRELGGEIRRMFRAPEGYVLVDADYSQIELRLLAHISGDETMQRAFLDGEDIHAVTASQVFDIPLSEVTSVQRSRAKAVNFGIVYGISAFSLSQNIHVSVQEAKDYIDRYLTRYSGVREYQKRVVRQGDADGYVSTLFSRRRELPELRSPNFNLRSFGERVAMNMPIQGTAADVMKLAMIRVHDRLKKEGLRSRLILQIHDELIVEAPEAEAEAVAVILREEMEGAVQYSVPLTAETGTGKTWYDAK